MDKVKITQEQANAITFAQGMDYYKDNKGALLGGHWIAIVSEGYETWAEELFPLNTMTFDQLAIALYVGYEIEGVNHD